MAAPPLGDPGVQGLFLGIVFEAVATHPQLLWRFDDKTGRTTSSYAGLLTFLTELRSLAPRAEISA